jgi:hypothetical protein
LHESPPPVLSTDSRISEDVQSTDSTVILEDARSTYSRISPEVAQNTDPRILEDANRIKRSLAAASEVEDLQELRAQNPQMSHIPSSPPSDITDCTDFTEKTVDQETFDFGVVLVKQERFNRKFRRMIKNTILWHAGGYPTLCIDQPLTLLFNYHVMEFSPRTIKSSVGSLGVGENVRGIGRVKSVESVESGSNFWKNISDEYSKSVEKYA